MYDLTALGRRIRRIRRAKDMTQAALGAAVGIAQNSVSAMENGDVRPSVETLTKIAETLDTTVGALLGENEGQDAAPDLHAAATVAA